MVGDAALQASKAPTSFVLRWYNRWYVYAGITLIWLFAPAPAVQGALQSAVRTFTITSGSMEPALLPGDHMAATAGPGGTLSRGDIVVFHWPDDANASFISRAVGVTGDTLEMRARALFVNGLPLKEPYVQISGDEDMSHEWMNWQVGYLVRDDRAEPYRPNRETWGPIAIPPYMYFVLGYDRDESLDSRFRGLIGSADVIGRPRRLYFSRDADNGSVRWGRIGLTIK